MSIKSIFGRRNAVHVLTLAGVIVLSACSMTGGQLQEGIGFREARFTEISTIREWRNCRDEAIELDRQARQEASPALAIAGLPC